MLTHEPETDLINSAPPVEHPDGDVMPCPECHEYMVYKGVMLAGNFLYQQPSKPYERWDCPKCQIVAAGKIRDDEYGWTQWSRQGNAQK